MATAAAYIRVSSERQDEYSPDSQIKLILEYAGKNGYEIPDEFIFFDDGISAKSSAKRIQFNRMIALAKEKNPPFSVILVWKFSRFARNQEESIVYKKILRKKGVQVISISEPIADSPFGNLIERIIEWMDEYYLINLSTEVKRGMSEKISRGEPLCPPAFGYSNRDGKYIINQVEADYVVNFFEDYSSGIPLRQIALKCRAKNLKTHRGNPFEARTIQYILTNPVYLGKLRWTVENESNFGERRPILIDGIHQPIISQELWDSVQKRIAKDQSVYKKYQRRDQKTEWMLKGLVRCECGATLTRLSSAHPSMQCHKYTKGGSCDISHYLSISKADALVKQNLRALINNKKFSFRPSKETDKINYEALIKREHSKLTRAKEAFLAEIDTLDEYRQNKGKILKKIAELELNYSKSQNKKVQNNIKKERRILDTLEDTTVSEKAKSEVLNSVISKIVFTKSQNSLDFYFYI